MESHWGCERKHSQDRFFVHFWLIWHWFWSILTRFFVDFRTSRLRRSHKIGGSKKNCVILTARLGSCVVQTQGTTRASFEMIFSNITCSGFFRCVPTSAPSSCDTYKLPDYKLPIGLASEFYNYLPSHFYLLLVVGWPHMAEHTKGICIKRQ